MSMRISSESSASPDESDTKRSASLDEDEPDTSSNLAAQETATTHLRLGGGNNKDDDEPPDLVSLEETTSPVEEDEEEGADHAESENETPWSAQTQQSTCEFTHIITGYGAKRESGCKKAEYSETTVDEFGNRWRLIIYVNGNGRASNHHLSLFLQVADAEDLPFGWKKNVSYVLTLEHPKSTNLSYAKRNPDKTFKLCPKAIDWGWSQFITSDRIQQEGFIADDSLTVRASVTVKSSSVSIDAEDSELYLKCAVEEGDAESVNLCLDHGASVNCKFKDDLYTPLHTACSSGASKGSIEVLNLLLERDADPNACNKWRETPLLIAANNGHYEACEALLDNGADPSLCSEAGWSALTFAAHKGFDTIVELLLKRGAPVNTKVSEDNSTPLHKACAGSKAGHLASVRLLLEHKADVHALNKWRETPLLTAANHGQAGAVELLLAAGADPCKCTDTGWSPLSIAAYKGHDEVVRLLLEEGAPTEEEDPTLSALLQAATKGLSGTVELLLQNGADHTVTTKKGDTALSILVEQGLTDTAVEMVTKYNASISRCSRDRKKVQRARLQINLRMKQLEKEGKLRVDSDSDESDDDGSAQLVVAQHQPNGTKRKSKKNGKGKEPGQSAEEVAKAAEEALLLELEKEDEKAKKEEAEANSKRAKKKKKKERERQQKMKEEEERRKREEQEAEERERRRKEAEERQRKEQEEKLKEQKEREMKEMMEREKILEAKRKERERREREQTKLREKSANQPPSPAGSQNNDKRQKQPQQKKPASPASVAKQEPAPSNKSSVPAKVAPLAGNRRWETKAKSPSATSSSAKQAPSLPRASSVPSSSSGESLPSTILSPRPTSMTERNPAKEIFREKVGPTSPSQTSPPQSSTSRNIVAEHPAIALFRREKVAEMIQRCSLVLNFDEATIKRVVFRWMLRASHDTMPFRDPFIPSWTDLDLVVTHFQRQFISEHRRSGSTQAGATIEALREAGSSVALICQEIAKEVEALRDRINSQLPSDWTDAALGMAISERVHNNMECRALVSWANRASVEVPMATLASLRERHIGPDNRFLSSVFVSKVWYETKQLIGGDTGLDVSLGQSTQECLSSDARVSVELWSSPYSVFGRNVFWGSFEEIDVLFGGQTPFAKEGSSSEAIIAQHGGSVSVVVPPDPMVASRYISRLLDVADAADRADVATSFWVFVHTECFHDLPNGPTANDLHLICPALASSRRDYLKCVEVLPAGQHAFRCESAPGKMLTMTSNSLLLVLQNNAGIDRFPLTPNIVSRVVKSLSIGMLRLHENPVVTPVGFQAALGLREPPLTPQPGYFNGLAQISPDPQRLPQSNYGAINGGSAPKAFSPSAGEVISRTGSRASRHGLFDLVDDGEEDPLNVELVSGMLNNLDVGLFQPGSIGSDVDIEAISLMGIGGPPAPPPNPGNSHRRRFG